MRRVSALFLRADIAALWQDIDALSAAFALEGDVLRIGPGRETLRVTIDNKRYIVKRHRGVGWREILKNLFLLRAPVLGARNEFIAALRLEAAGVPSLNVAAYAARGINPATQQSFILCDDIAHRESLEKTALRWRVTRPSCSARWAMIARVAHIAGAMHAAGVNHRDFYLCHLLCADHNELRLIDLHRAQTRLRTPRRWRVKDLGALYFSALDVPLTARDRLRFVRDYHAGHLPRTAAQWQLWRDVEARAQQLYAKGLRSGLVGNA